jgi:hypothetical protein
MRNLAEFYALFSFILIPYVSKVLNSYKLFNQIVMVGLMVVIVVLNIQLSYAYGGCFEGRNDWDFAEYFRLIKTV